METWGGGGGDSPHLPTRVEPTCQFWGQTEVSGVSQQHPLQEMYLLELSCHPACNAPHFTDQGTEAWGVSSQLPKVISKSGRHRFKPERARLQMLAPPGPSYPFQLSLNFIMTSFYRKGDRRSVWLSILPQVTKQSFDSSPHP